MNPKPTGKREGRRGTARSILVADDELDVEEVQEWIDSAAMVPSPTLLFAPDKSALFNLLKGRADDGLKLPDVVFLDLNLKTKKLGLEALKDLKNSKVYSEIPVVIYSQSSDESDIRETNALRANSYLTKGVGHTQGMRFADALKYWFTLDKFCGSSR